MPAAIAIPLIVSAASAGAQVYGAHKAAGAAKDAARTQTKAGNQALDLQRDIYQDQMARQQPYMDAGRNAVTNLQTMGGQSMPTFNGQMPGGGWRPPTQNPMPQPQAQAPQQIPNPYAVMAPRSSRADQQPMGQNPYATMTGPMGGPMGGGQMVKMRGPDGSVRDVPSNQVPMWEQRGAQVVR